MNTKKFESRNDVNKVYLVELDNGELYEDYATWIEKVFSTYRKASQYLVDEGYEPYYSEWEGNHEIDFYLEEKSYRGEVIASSIGNIIEMELE